MKSSLRMKLQGTNYHFRYFRCLFSRYIIFPWLEGEVGGVEGIGCFVFLCILKQSSYLADTW